MKNRLDEVVYIVRRDRVVETRIRDLDPREFTQCTVTAAGNNAPTFFRNGRKIWALSTSQAWPVCSFASEKTAAQVLDELLADDFECSDLLAFRSRADAEQCLREMA
ncbi:hypothetical protein [Paraburkholderia kururiensis]|uniref:hypothetical protein n=1 Tax=Paraburkholderia kururiensis TaxID=984307 RepID=UPI0005A5F7F3|nr:hypothetical protein [Paraburkholderia kururiensis]